MEGRLATGPCASLRPPAACKERRLQACFKTSQKKAASAAGGGGGGTGGNGGGSVRDVCSPPGALPSPNPSCNQGRIWSLHAPGRLLRRPARPWRGPVVRSWPLAGIKTMHRSWQRHCQGQWLAVQGPRLRGTAGRSTGSVALKAWSFNLKVGRLRPRLLARVRLRCSCCIGHCLCKPCSLTCLCSSNARDCRSHGMLPLPLESTLRQISTQGKRRSNQGRPSAIKLAL